MNKKLLPLTLMAFSSNAFSAAHLLPELGSLNASTAGAGSAALAESALTAWTNPAGMSQLNEANLTVNASMLGTSIDFVDTQGNSTQSNSINGGSWAPAASMYFVTPIDDKFHAGVALASQGGAGVDYGDDFSGAALLKDVEFMTVQFMPSISYKMNEKLSIGLSANLEYLTANGNLDPIQDDIRPNIPDGLLAADAKDFTIGYSLSAFYKFNKQHRIGLIYRSEIDHYGEGDVKQTGGAFSTSVGLDFIMPQNVQASGVHAINSEWDMLWSVTWYDLSTWTDLTLDIGEQPGLTVQERDFDDVWNLAVGTHYQLNERLRLETGVSYETSPQDDPTKQYMDLPVGETKRIGFGATYILNNQWQFKGYYDYINLGDPEINYKEVVKGSYDNSAHFFGLQANFKFN